MTHSLDPKDWSAFRARARDMLESVLDHMETYGEGPVWQSPDEMESRAGDLSETGRGAGATDDGLKALLPYGVGNTSPRFFGWVHGAGTPSGLMAEMVGAALNANCGGRNHAAIRVERELVSWGLKLFGFPEDGSGLVTTGTSAATLIALKVARDKRLGKAVRKAGIADAPKLVGYTSAGAHACLDRAFDILGLGSDALRKVEMMADGRMNLAALEAALEADRKAGLTPFLVCATAGTVNRGAIDDLKGIASICQRDGLWFHVDAAFAAALKLSATHKRRLTGIEKADSLAFDFHKWMQVNYDAGCVLIRDREAHLAAFSDRPAYLAGSGRGVGSDAPWPVDFGPELSRGFRALKVWAQLKEHGEERLGAVVDANIRQAGYLADLVKRENALELLSYEGLNICCFRYRFEGESDALNEELLLRLQESGVAVPSSTRINDAYAIRVNITNHRTQMDDMDQLIRAVLAIGGELAN